MLSKSEKSPKDSSEILADRGQSEGLGVCCLDDRLKRYAKGKSRALRIVDYINNSKNDAIFGEMRVAKYTQAISVCGSYLVFKDYYLIEDNRLVAANFCKKHLLCPFCAMRRGARYLKAYLERLETAKQGSCEISDLRAYFVTLTIKDGVELEDVFTRLKTAFCKMMKMRRNASTRGVDCEMTKAFGGVYSFEVKRGKNSGLWHPHVHCVWWCKSQPDQAKLSSEWLALTGDSFIVDVRELYENEGKNSIISGFVEVFKYALKFSDMNEEDTVFAANFLARKKLVGSFGFLYGVKIPENLEDEEIDEQPFNELFYKYCQDKYILSSVVFDAQRKNDVRRNLAH